jgi:transposase
MMIRARAILVETRTALINAARGLTKSYGERLPSCGTYQMGRDQAESLSPAIRAALDPLLAEVETVTERIQEYDRQLEELCKTRYPEAKLLKQVHGVGTLIALTFVLTVEDPHRFGKSRAVGCYVGLRPKRRQSGQSRPELGISKEGDAYLRTLLVQGAHHVLGPFGKDSDLRRWGLKLAAHGGKNAKKRAVVAVARKLAVLLHKLWVSKETYEPLRMANRAQIVAA